MSTEVLLRKRARLVLFKIAGSPFHTFALCAFGHVFELPVLEQGLHHHFAAAIVAQKLVGRRGGTGVFAYCSCHTYASKIALRIMQNEKQVKRVPQLFLPALPVSHHGIGAFAERSAGDRVQTALDLAHTHYGDGGLVGGDA